MQRAVQSGCSIQRVQEVMDSKMHNDEMDSKMHNDEMDSKMHNDEERYIVYVNNNLKGLYAT